jgi:hypothetical protein
MSTRGELLRTRVQRAVVARYLRWVAETVALVILCVCGLLALIALDAVLRNGLWGEWAFAMIACSLGIWLLARLVAPWLPPRSQFVPPRLWQTPIWAAVPLVGIPFALLTRWSGVSLFVGVLATGLIALSVVPLTLHPWLQPVQWIAAVAAVGAVTAFVWTGPTADFASPAEATPLVPGAMSLASRYRPRLFFDSRERFFPMNITAAMKAGNVAQCRYGLRGPDCHDVTAPQQLDPSYDFLSIAGGSPVDPSTTGGQSSYYVHVVRHGTNLYLDYWWYYAQNPLPVAKRIFCGPGLRAPEISCFEHPADWEGLTVVLGPCAANTNSDSPCHRTPAGMLRVVAVKYAEHRSVKRRSGTTSRSVGRSRDSCHPVTNVRSHLSLLTVTPPTRCPARQAAE